MQQTSSSPSSLKQWSLLTWQVISEHCNGKNDLNSSLKPCSCWPPCSSMSRTTCRRLPTSRWSTSGLFSISYFPSLRFWSTPIWTPSGGVKHLKFPNKGFFWNRDDEDREINHHGRPVDVGETETVQANVIKVKPMLLDTWQYLTRPSLRLLLILFIYSSSRLLRRTLLLWMKGFSRRH